MPTEYLPDYAFHPKFTQKYTLGQEIGYGSSGFVVSAFERDTGIERAVKFIIKERIEPINLQLDPELGIIPTEIYTLKQLRHENVVGFCDAYQDKRFFYLVMEISGSPWDPPALSDSSQSTVESSPEPQTPRDLFECMKIRGCFEEELAKKVFKQVAECVAYLQDKQICHRDIKEENILIDHDFKVKLVDFGAAVILKNHDKLCERLHGTLPYTAPEVLEEVPHKDEPTEIWALGILLYSLVFKQDPFDGYKTAVLKMNPNIPISDECAGLIKLMLKKNPLDRPTIQQVLDHPWLSGNL